MGWFSRIVDPAGILSHGGGGGGSSSSGDTTDQNDASQNLTDSTVQTVTDAVMSDEIGTSFSKSNNSTATDSGNIQGVNLGEHASFSAFGENSKDVILGAFDVLKSAFAPDKVKDQFSSVGKSAGNGVRHIKDNKVLYIVGGLALFFLVMKSKGKK